MFFYVAITILINSLIVTWALFLCRLRISCRYLGLKCEEALTSGELLDHLITHHGLIAHAMETTEVCQKFQRDHLIEVVNSSKEWDPVLLITAGRAMFLRTVAENGHIVWRLFLIHENGDHAVVPKIELTVLNKNKKVSVES